MKTELRLADHGLVPGAKVVEVWHGGKFIGQITGADGPGVRVMSKNKLMADGVDLSKPGAAVNIIEVRIIE